MWYDTLTGVRFDGIPRARAEHLRAPFFPVEDERRSQLGPPRIPVGRSRLWELSGRQWASHHSMEEGTCSV